MKFYLYKVSGYEEAIMALRMSKGKYYSWKIAQAIQDLVYVATNKQGFLAKPEEYLIKSKEILSQYSQSKHLKITGDYDKDVNEFKRLLGLTMDASMGKFDHHTLMKYIDISFFTDGLHRGAQDDLDAHAPAFNNRITRFSTRLAEISEQKMSDWYKDKVITFKDALDIIQHTIGTDFKMPNEIVVNNNTYRYTPFGYVLKEYSQVPAKNGLAKDVQRGLMALGTPSSALWKIDLFNLRYVYYRRGKLTKANPELREGMEQLADQIEASVPVFGEFFRKQMTDTGKWEHIGKIKTVTEEEYRLIQSASHLA